MNELTLNNTSTVQGTEHVGGFVLVKRTGDGRWRAEQWSAFFARLVLPENCCTFYLEGECPVAEFSTHNLPYLSDRLEAVGEPLCDTLIFGVPENLRVSEKAFERWKKELE